MITEKITEKIEPKNEIERIRIPEKDSDSRSEVISNDLFKRGRRADFDLGFIGGSQKRAGVRLSLWMWLATTIDALILMSVSCFLMLGLSLIVKYKFYYRLGFLISPANFSLTFAVLFFASGWMYFISTRSLVGASIGEWTCALRVGQPHERASRYYLSRVVLRTTLTLLTGVAVLPLLSLIFNKDLAGRITGLHIYSLK